ASKGCQRRSEREPAWRSKSRPVEQAVIGVPEISSPKTVMLGGILRRSAKPPNLRPSQRQSVLDQRRGLKMAVSAHAYVRGNTLKFYEWLEFLERGTLPEGPAIWICGDCHVGNLGPGASAEGKVE